MCTALHLAITRIFDTHANGVAEPRIGKLVVQLDNAVSVRKIVRGINHAGLRLPSFSLGGEEKESKTKLMFFIS